MPIQRLPRYCLLLKEVGNCLDEKETIKNKLQVKP